MPINTKPTTAVLEELYRAQFSVTVSQIAASVTPAQRVLVAEALRALIPSAASLDADLGRATGYVCSVIEHGAIPEPS